MSASASTRPVKLRPWQFTLKRFFCALTIVCLSAWIGVELYAIYDESRAVDALTDLRLPVYYDYQCAGFTADEIGDHVIRPLELPTLYSSDVAQRRPHWLCAWLRRDCVHDVVAVRIDQEHIAEALPHLRRLPRLRYVAMYVGASCLSGAVEEEAAANAIRQEFPHVEIVYLRLPNIVG